MLKHEVDVEVAALLNALADGNPVQLADTDLGVLTDEGSVISERLREVARGLSQIEHQI